MEIGPGDGAITMPLSEKVKHLTIVEKDKRLIPILTNKLLKNRPVKIINEDVLKCNFQQKIRNNVRVIGNLPYNITTEIIFKILEKQKTIPPVRAHRHVGEPADLRQNLHIINETKNFPKFFLIGRGQ